MFVEHIDLTAASETEPEIVDLTDTSTKKREAEQPPGVIEAKMTRMTDEESTVSAWYQLDDQEDPKVDETHEMVMMFEHKEESEEKSSSTLGDQNAPEEDIMERYWNKGLTELVNGDFQFGEKTYKGLSWHCYHCTSPMLKNDGEWECAFCRWGYELYNADFKPYSLGECKTCLNVGPEGLKCPYCMYGPDWRAHKNGDNLRMITQYVRAYLKEPESPVEHRTAWINYTLYIKQQITEVDRWKDRIYRIEVGGSPIIYWVCSEDRCESYDVQLPPIARYAVNRQTPSCLDQ
jgi:hypothetical protein